MGDGNGEEAEAVSQPEQAGRRPGHSHLQKWEMQKASQTVWFVIPEGFCGLLGRRG